MFVIIEFPSVINRFAVQFQTKKIRGTFCSSGGSGKTLMQTRKPTECNRERFGFLVH